MCIRDRAKFDGHDPKLYHVDPCPHELILSCLSQTLVNNKHVQSTIENGQSAEEDMLELAFVFVKRFGSVAAACKNGAHITVKCYIQELTTSFNAFGAILDPWPFAFAASYTDVENALKYEGEDEESPFQYFTEALLQSDYYRGAIERLKEVQFEEDAIGKRINEIKQSIEAGDIADTSLDLSLIHI